MRRRSPLPPSRGSSRPGSAWPRTASPTPTRAPPRSTPRCGGALAVHRLAGRRVRAPDPAGRYRDQDTWVDSAVADAHPGISDPDLGVRAGGLSWPRVRPRRTAHDRAFGTALAGYTADDPARPAGEADESGTWRTCCRPSSSHWPAVAPVLLLVLDGMSAGVATEVLAGVLSRTGGGWVEALLPGQIGGRAAVAVLPTLTEVSRASLLTGALTPAARMPSYAASGSLTGLAAPGSPPCSTRSRWIPPGSATPSPMTSPPLSAT